MNQSFICLPCCSSILPVALPGPRYCPSPISFCCVYMYDLKRLLASHNFRKNPLTPNSIVAVKTYSSSLLPLPDSCCSATMGTCVHCRSSMSQPWACHLMVGSRGDFLLGHPLSLSSLSGMGCHPYKSSHAATDPRIATMRNPSRKPCHCRSTGED
jgi:hypothetical protein